MLCDTAVVGVPDRLPVCLGCLGRPDPAAPCPGGCGAALCSPACPGLAHHQLQECGVLARDSGLLAGVDWSKPVPHGIFPVLAVLRFLLLRHHQPHLHTAVAGLMDHWEERQTEPDTLLMVTEMTQFCRSRLGLDWVTQDLVCNAFGVLKTNGVGQGRVFLFPTLSLVSHACAANLDMVGPPDWRVEMVAKRDIQRGEELTWCYTKFLQPQPRLQASLRHSWHFDCSCRRCGDPSELGSWFSSWRCTCGTYYGNTAVECEKCGAALQPAARAVEDAALVGRVGAGREAELVQLAGPAWPRHSSHHTTVRLYSRLDYPPSPLPTTPCLTAGCWSWRRAGAARLWWRPRCRARPGCWRC